MRSRTVILTVLLLLVISVALTLSVSGHRDSHHIPDDASSPAFREISDGEAPEESLAGMIEILRADENDYPSNPLIYLQAFWEYIVKAPEDASFFRRIINFLLAVRGQKS